MLIPEIRNTHLTATDSAKILGIAKFGSIIDPYNRIVNGVYDSAPQSQDIMRGQYLEDGIGKWYAAMNNYKLLPVDTTEHPTNNHICASPDALVLRDMRKSVKDVDRILEIKSPRRAEDWGDVPEYYLPQLVIEMACLNMESADLCGLVFGELVIHTVERDLELEGIILEAMDKYWVDHILAKIPPTPDGSENYDAYLTNMLKRKSAEYVIADEKLSGSAAKLHEIRTSIESLEEQKKTIEQQMKISIGEFSGIKGEGWKVNWSVCKGREKVDWKAYAIDLGGSEKGVDKYTSRGEDFRQFRFTFGK